MQNIRLILEYDGTNYQGFERKNATHTISNKLTAAIQRLSGESISLHAAVRTDPGVHAKIQIVNFTLETTVSLPHFMATLNHALPLDIAVRQIDYMPVGYRASLGIESYTYQCMIDIAEIPDVFHLNYACHTGPDLDIVSMKQAAAQFIGTHDFSAFTTGKRNKNPMKTVSELTLSSNEDNTKLLLTITANSFLRYMPQAICGVILQSGTGTIHPSQIHEIFEGQRQIDVLCPSKALHLTHISYLA